MLFFNPNFTFFQLLNICPYWCSYEHIKQSSAIKFTICSTFIKFCVHSITINILNEAICTFNSICFALDCASFLDCFSRLCFSRSFCLFSRFSLTYFKKNIITWKVEFCRNEISVLPKRVYIFVDFDLSFFFTLICSLQLIQMYTGKYVHL